MSFQRTGHIAYSRALKVAAAPVEACTLRDAPPHDDFTNKSTYSNGGSGLDAERVLSRGLHGAYPFEVILERRPPGSLLPFLPERALKAR